MVAYKPHAMWLYTESYPYISGKQGQEWLSDSREKGLLSRVDFLYDFARSTFEKNVTLFTKVTKC